MENFDNKEVEDRVNNKNPKLLKQYFSLLKEGITPETLEVISRQATINIGTIGHVAHGKTTLVKSISGVNTNKHATEKKTTKTIHLGYANAKLYKCNVCPDKNAYRSAGSGKEDEYNCEICKEGICKLQRHVSFVDCPGHDLLMATMLNGAAIMDSALLLVAANESCPQPQTAEHLIAVEKMNLQNIIIVQNKVDMVIREGSEVKAKEQYEQIKKFVRSTNAHNAPIIPISAQFKYNIDVLLEKLCQIPVPKRDLEAPPKFIVVRSFDNNRPGTSINDLVGGSAGGTLIRGILKVNDEIEVRPGLVERDQNNNIKCRPYITRITTIRCEDNELLFAIPGGLISLGTFLDPSLTGKDRLVGNVRLK